MTTWTDQDLEKINATDELQLATLNKNEALQKPVTIWTVRVGKDLYVRAYRGRESAWFRHTQQRHEGHIDIGGISRNVTFEDVSNNQDLNNKIDNAYQSKYQKYNATILDPMLTPQARATTLKLVPVA